MAHHVEPMEVDNIDSDFDNKENAYRHSNVLPCTEKGYEELDVSELNMKLRYSITPVSSPMSKSYTAYVDNRNLVSDGSLNCTNENANLTRSLNSTMTSDSVIKSLKTLPLQTISTEQITDNNRSSVLRQLDSTITGDDNNVTVTITGVHDIDENLSLPSSSSSVIHTPEATTPTNITKNEERSPIIRGLKSVFNMFRSSQSPVPPVENDTSAEKAIDLDETYCPDDQKPLASTPISAHRSRDGSTSKRSSPLKDSITFNDDLEKELQWKDDTIFFSGEKIPIHKLFLLHNIPASTSENHQKDQKPTEDNLNATIEYMDVSYSNPIVLDSTVTDTQNNNAVESDGEFVDCETTFSKDEFLNVGNQKDPLSTTLDVLDVTKNIENDSKVNENVEVETQRNNFEKVASKLLNTTNEISVEIPTINKTIESKPNEPVSSNDADKTINVTSIIVDEVPKKIENDSNNQKEPVTDAENLLDKTTENVIQSISDVNNGVESPENIEICNENIETVCINNLALTESVTSLVKPEQAGSDVSIISKCNLSIDILSKEAELEVDISLLEEKLKDLSNTFEVDLKKAKLEKDINITQPITNDTTSVSESGDYPNVSKECQIESASDITYIEPNVVILQDTKFNPDGLTDNKDIGAKVDNTEQDLRECIPSHNTDVNIMNASTEGSIQNDNQSQVFKEFNTNLIETPMDEVHPECPAISNLPLEEPANIPLPDDDDDFDIDMGVNVETLETVQSVPPGVLDTVKTESKLDVTDTLCLDKVFENVSTIENVNSKLELPSSENLDKTQDIVNSLTEIIGESLNNTATECMLDQSQRDEPIKGIESTNNIQVLPDLVNQTINNMTIDIEPVHEISNQIQSVSSSETIPAMHKSSETILNATEEHKSLTEPLDTSLIKNESKQSNAAINLNEEHTNAVDSDNIDIVPETNREESQNANAQNELNENNVLNVDVHHDATKDASEVAGADEELVLSENNSPYVSVIAEPIDHSKPSDESFEKIDIPLTTTNEAPSSPPIRSRGYNFNFDEMDDPFATKNNIRESPPTNSAEDNYENIIEAKKMVPNRRKSQPPERKKPTPSKKKFNNSFDAGAKNLPSNKYKDQNTEGDSKNASVDIAKNTTVTMESNDAFDKEVADILDSTQVLNNVVQENLELISEHNVTNPLVEDLMPPVHTTIEISADIKPSIESVTLATSQSKTSSSEQSTYYSAAASSSDSSISRNVFNLPEIDDKNFNPFATKSKMRQSPPIDYENENPFATKTKMRASPNSELAAVWPKNKSYLGDEDKMDTELMEKDTSYDTSHTTSSSKSTDDINITTHRVNTEDEDTEEGPFLEAEDAIEKFLGMDNDDMMQFNEIPAQASEENADGGELFIDAEAFEFLLNQNKSNVVADSGKESLFLKFDPLFAKRISSDGVLAALKKRQSTPTKPTRPSLRNEASPIAGPSTLNVTCDEETNITQESVEDLNVTVAKPMMVVTPAVNPAVTPRNKTTTPPRSNRRSITFTSPAMAVIDRLLSLSGNSSFMGHDTSNTQVSREHTEADLALTQLRELLAEKEISVYQLRSESKELKDRLSSMETQVKILEADGQERLKKINDLNDRLAEKTKVNKSMAAVVEEYERTIASLIAETEQDKKRHAEERMRLINERDEQTAHLASMEVSFSDLHSKYEKSKQVILSCKANEETCKKSMKEFEVNLTKQLTNYEMLKQHATSKLNHANQELQKMTKAHESEVLKLNAMIKRKDMHITSLEETLAQKTKANEELTAICDELINKVG